MGEQLSTPLTPTQIVHLALQARIRGLQETDVPHSSTSIEHHPDLSQLAVKAALIDLEQPEVPVERRYGYDDTDEFHQTQLHGDIPI